MEAKIKIFPAAKNFKRHKDPRFRECVPVKDPMQRYMGAMLPAETMETVLSRSAWRRGSTRVLSTFEWAPYASRTGMKATGEGPQFHLVLSWGGKRSHSLDTGRVIRAFGLDDKITVELHTTLATHLWCAADALHRTACLVDNMLGPREHAPAPCLACDVAELLGKQCQVHK